MKSVIVFVCSLSIILFYGCGSSTVSVEKKKTIVGDYSQFTLKGPKRRVFVSEFKNLSAYGQNRLGKSMSDILTTELSRTNAFILLEREKLDLAIKEQKLGQTGLIDERNAPTFGKIIGANAIVTGSVSQFGVRTETSDYVISNKKEQVAKCEVDIRIIDVNTGQIIWAGSGKGKATRTYSNLLGSGSAGGYDETLEGDAFRAAVVSVMEDLVKALTKTEWTCTIAEVITTSKIYINAGRKSNLDLNTLLNVYRIGKPIIDPVSGIEIGREEDLIGISKVISYLGEDGAVIEMIQGELPSRGDICKIK